MHNAILKLDQITYAKSFKNKAWSETMAKGMRLFAISWNSFAIVDELSSDTDWTVNAVAAGGAIGLSVPLQLLFKSKTHKLNKKYRLRMMDLRMRDW